MSDEVQFNYSLISGKTYHELICHPYWGERHWWLRTNCANVQPLIQNTYLKLMEMQTDIILHPVDISGLYCCIFSAHTFSEKNDSWYSALHWPVSSTSSHSNWHLQVCALKTGTKNELMWCVLSFWSYHGLITRIN